MAGLWLVFIWAKKCLADSRRFVDSSWQLCFAHKAATGFKIEVKYSGTIFELRKVVILYTGYLSVAKTLNTNCFVLAFVTVYYISHNNAFNKINKQRIRNDYPVFLFHSLQFNPVFSKDEEMAGHDKLRGGFS